MSGNKTAVVTGAAKGIGKAIAMRLARDGYDLVCVYNSSAEAANETAKEIESLGVQCESINCDVSNYEAVQVFAKMCFEKYSKIDVLVNNSGITADTLLSVMKEEAFDKVIDVNLKGTFNMMRHFARKMMKQRSGSIVNISSVVGVIGNAGQTNYQPRAWKTP